MSIMSQNKSTCVHNFYHHSENWALTFCRMSNLFAPFAQIIMHYSMEFWTTWILTMKYITIKKINWKLNFPSFLAYDNSWFMYMFLTKFSSNENIIYIHCTYRFPSMSWDFTFLWMKTVQKLSYSEIKNLTAVIVYVQCVEVNKITVHVSC